MIQQSITINETIYCYWLLNHTKQSEKLFSKQYVHHETELLRDNVSACYGKVSWSIDKHNENGFVYCYWLLNHINFENYCYLLRIKQFMKYDP
jgi:hypothetical protein